MCSTRSSSAIAAGVVWKSISDVVALGHLADLESKLALAPAIDGIHHAPVSGDDALDLVQDGRAGLLVERGVEQKQQFVSLHCSHLPWANTAPGL